MMKANIEFISFVLLYLLQLLLNVMQCPYDFIGCKIHQTACPRKNIMRWNYFVLQI